MKKLTLCLLTIFSYSFLMAQTFPVSISGTVSNLDGTPADGIDIHLTTDSLNVDFEYSGQTITTANGTYHFNFDVPSANSQGSVLVSMENCNNNFETEELSWSPTNTNLTADFTYCPATCDVSITTEPHPSGGDSITILTANSTGTAPFIYEWETGETMASISIIEYGVYCVTVTDANACVSSNCSNVVGQNIGCWTEIIEVQTDAWLLAQPHGGIAPFTYSWNTGSTESSTEIEGGGDYCVTVVDADSCISVTCVTHISGEADNYIVQGVVSPIVDTNDVFLEDIVGLVYLIVHDENAGTLTAIDTVEIEDFGYYNFGEVAAGNYLIKAAYSEESELYENHLPTYHANSLWWDEATMITVPSIGWGAFNIKMIEGENPGGPGFIGGLISEGANFDGQVVDERTGDPLVDVSVLLLTESDEPVTHTVSDENGEFDFPNVAWGTYKVYLEIVGLEQVFHMVTINSDQPEVTNLTFEVGEEIVLSVSSFLTDEALQVFPNPTQNEFVVSINSPQNFEANINMTNLQGQTVWSQAKTIHAGGQQIDCSMTNLPKGIYFLNVRTGKTVISKKIVKL